jgi:hypothetical protein
MNHFVTGVLVVIALAWISYIAGARDRRIAFTLWFPFTATCLIGTVVWLWAALALLGARSGGGEAEGWAIFGAWMMFGGTSICPIILGISLWQRPKAGAYGLWNTVPVVALYLGLIFSYHSVSGLIENQKLNLVVLDTKMVPVAHAKVTYESTPRSNHLFSFPAASLNGEIETGTDGVVVVPVAKTQQIDIKVTMSGYASLRVSMDRAWGNYTWHQTHVDWQFPPDNPNKSWDYHGGMVQTDVDSGDVMHLAVYLPRTRSEMIPNYGPMRVCDEENGKQVWTPIPSVIHAQ